MKVTTTIVAHRGDTEVALVLTPAEDENGTIEAYLPPADRKAAATFTVDVNELLRAARHLADVPRTTAVIPGQTDIEEALRGQPDS